MSDPTPQAPGDGQGSALAVLRNRPFLLLWLSQVATQIGVIGSRSPFIIKSGVALVAQAPTYPSSG